MQQPYRNFHSDLAGATRIDLCRIWTWYKTFFEASPKHLSLSRTFPIQNIVKSLIHAGGGNKGNRQGPWPPQNFRKPLEILKLFIIFYIRSQNLSKKPLYILKTTHIKKKKRKKSRLHPYLSICIGDSAWTKFTPRRVWPTSIDHV